MDIETEGFYGECLSVEEFDIDYEFDAPRFCDFSRPETVSEAREAETWFDCAESYPPSPSSGKKGWRYDPLKECVGTCPESHTNERPNPFDACFDAAMDSEAATPEDKYNGFIYYNETVKDSPKATTKPEGKSSVSRSSTLMKPTACLLARQKKPLDVYSIQVLRRCQRSLSRSDGGIPPALCAVIQSQDTKRQKLEVGYLRKVCRLEQALLAHKEPKRVGRVNSFNGRSKVTIPIEPELKTAQRAERHRSKVNSERGEKTQPSSWTSKALPGSKKIPDASSPAFLRRNTPRLPEFKAFHLRTSERATQRASSNIRTARTDASMSESETARPRMLKSVNNSKKEKSKETHSSKAEEVFESNACDVTMKISGESEVSNFGKDTTEDDTMAAELESPRLQQSFQDEPPLESFSNFPSHLTLSSDVKSRPHMQIADEDVNMVVKRSESFHGKHCACGVDESSMGIEPLLNINRSWDIC